MTDIILFFIDNPNIYLITVMFLSLFIGSFLNVVIYRLPKMLESTWDIECRLYLGLPLEVKNKLSLSYPFSHCTQCQHPIKPWHNIPILSYLFLLGRCAYCQATIAITYPLIELTTCIMSLYIAMHFGVSFQALSALCFTWIIIALTFIDLKHHILPDQLTFLLLWIGLFSSIFNLFCNTQDAIIGGIAGYLIFALIQGLFKMVTGKEGMGQGDFKFLAAIGSFLGWHLLPIIILISSLSGIIFAFIKMIVKKDYKSYPIPFGPFLAAASWCALLKGEKIMQYSYNLLS